MPEGGRLQKVRECPFLVLAVASALVAIVASVWCDYGGESTLVVVTNYAAWACAGVFAFMSGARAEYGPWHQSWLLRGTVAAVVALLATVVGMGAANYHTISTTDDTTDAANALWRRHVSIVATTARKTRHRRVDTIRCTRGGVLECAVTYEGPACDLWFLELTSSGWEAVPKLTTLWRGTHATYDEDSDAVACSSGA